MSFKKVDLSFQSCKNEYDESDVVIFSVPMDWTTSFRPGTRFAGNQVRVDSFGIEWYSPYREANLKDFKTSDIGDLELPIGDVENSLKVVYETSKKIYEDHKFPVMIGGEHLVTLPVLQAAKEKYKNLHVIHLDAHTDLRESFFGRELSHATFMYHAHKFLGDHTIYQFGIRSGDQHEFDWAKKHIHQRKFDFEGLDKAVETLKHVPVYITIDIDVLDPSVVSGTGTPEPGGMQYKDLIWAFEQFEKLGHIVGCDLVELNPYLDPSGASTAVAVKTIRELTLILQKNILKNKSV
jgi:agmatinase